MPLARDLYEDCIAAFFSNYEFTDKKAAVLEVLKKAKKEDLSNVRLYANNKANDYKKLMLMSNFIGKLTLELNADNLLIEG